MWLNDIILIIYMKWQLGLESFYLGCYGWANLSFNHHYGWASLSNRQETDDTEWQNFVCVWQDIQPPLWLSGFIIIYLSNYHMPLVVCTINPFDMFCTWCIGNQWKTTLYIHLYHIYPYKPIYLFLNISIYCNSTISISTSLYLYTYKHIYI